MICECLEESRIMLAPEAGEYRQLIEKMLVLSATGNAVMNGKTICDHVLERDHRMPTALGKGVAVPRFISDQIDRNEIVVAVSASGLPLNDTDNKRVKIIFLLLLSVSTAYADLLAQCLRLLNDDAVKEEILQARSALEIIRVIQRWEQD